MMYQMYIRLSNIIIIVVVSCDNLSKTINNAKQICAKLNFNLLISGDQHNKGNNGFSNAYHFLVCFAELFASPLVTMWRIMEKNLESILNLSEIHDIFCCYVASTLPAHLP